MVCPVVHAWGLDRRVATHPFTTDHPQHSPAIAECVQVTDSVQPQTLVAGNLDNFEVGLARPQVDLCLNFEAITIDIEEVKASSPKGDVSIAQICKGGLEELIDDLIQHAVAKSTEPSDIVTPASGEKSRAFGEVSASQQRFDKGGYLARISGAISIHQYNDITGALSEPATQRISLPSAALLENLDIWHQTPRYRRGAVDRMSIHQDHLRCYVRYCRQDIGEILGFIESRNYNADARIPRPFVHTVTSLTPPVVELNYSDTFENPAMFDLPGLAMTSHYGMALTGSDKGGHNQPSTGPAPGIDCRSPRYRGGPKHRDAVAA
jgi:hypothetical protein